MINNEELLELLDFDPDFSFDEENEENVIVNGESIPYEMTLSLQYDDAHCMRVFIDGQYYYFG